MEKSIYTFIHVTIIIRQQKKVETRFVLMKIQVDNELTSPFSPLGGLASMSVYHRRPGSLFNTREIE